MASHGTGDLQHRDWVLKSQAALIAKINSDISTEIINTPDGGKRLLINYVDEESIQLLQFLTNTDQNNNYLYLESVSLILQGSLNPLEFPGLSETLVKTFELSDAAEFINGNETKTHIPFAPETFNGSSINQFVDDLSALLPYVPNTYGTRKFYNLVLNPDFGIPNKFF